MGRTPSGYRIFRRPGEHVWRLSFSFGRKQYKLSTGLSDETPSREPAENVRARAAELYAQTLGGKRPAPAHAPKRRAALGAEPLGETAARWLTDVSAELDVETADTYALYAGTHWEPFFAVASAISKDTAKAYARARLKRVAASTVRKELSALRSFAAWYFGDDGPPIPGIPKRVQGTPDPRAARSWVELSPDEIVALLEALPDRAAPRHGGWPIRARFVVMYRTGLRPATLDQLSVPQHYTHGAPELRIPPELDKARAGRPLPIDDVARAALDSVSPDEGLIFGKHDYRDAIAKAVEKLHEAGKLPKHKHPSPYDLRRMFCTHLAEESDNLPGLQFLMGHSSAATTAIYIKASKRAALDVLRSTGRLRSK